jgi:hypothetical protein
MVCVRGGVTVTGLVTAADYLWLEQGHVYSSILKMGFGYLDGHIKFIFLKAFISGNCTKDNCAPVSTVYYGPKKNEN